jgi:hypothetical protein
MHTRVQAVGTSNKVVFQYLLLGAFVGCSIVGSIGGSVSVGGTVGGCVGGEVAVGETVIGIPDTDNPNEPKS